MSLSFFATDKISTCKTWNECLTCYIKNTEAKTPKRRFTYLKITLSKLVIGGNANVALLASSLNGSASLSKHETTRHARNLGAWIPCPHPVYAYVCFKPWNYASRTVSRGDLSWRPFSSTSTSLTCQPSPESMHMWRPCNHACWWRLAGSRRGDEQGHGNARWIPPDLEAKAQHYKKRCRQSSISTTRKLNVSWKSTSTMKHCPSAPNPNTSE